MCLVFWLINGEGYAKSYYMSFVLLYEVQESAMHDGQFMWKLLCTLTFASALRHVYSLVLVFCFVPCAELCVGEAQIFSYADVAVIHVCAHSTHTHARTVTVMKLFIVQCSPSSCHLC